LTLGISGAIMLFMKFTRQILKKFLSPRDLVIFYRRWTEKEVCFLEENHGVLTVEEIAKDLHRSAGDIRYMKRLLQLDSVKPPWTDEQTQFLKDHKDWSIADLAEELGKSKNAIRKKLARL
jgi:predicted transcriptional regulator